MPAVQPGTKDRQNRCPDHHAQCVAADHMSYLRFGNPQIGGDGGHQPHDHELTGTNAKATHGQRQQNQPG